MAGRVLTGKQYLLKLIYNNVPYTFRINNYKDSDGAELRSRSHLGRRSEEQDRIQKNWSGSFTAVEDGPQLDLIQADIDARDDANLLPQPLILTITKVWRDGVTPPSVITLTGAVIKVDTNAGSRTDDVTRDVSFQADKRVVS